MNEWTKMVYSVLLFQLNGLQECQLRLMLKNSKNQINIFEITVIGNFGMFISGSKSPKSLATYEQQIFFRREIISLQLTIKRKQNPEANKSLLKAFGSCVDDREL